MTELNKVFKGLLQAAAHAIKPSVEASVFVESLQIRKTIPTLSFI